ncbi:MAG: dephospho-CoA kinase [Spirochaetota bacterium]
MASKRLIIGIVGAAASGKSLGAKILARELCARIIDVDALGHKALLAKKGAILRAFGPTVAAKNAIDRKALGAVVFASQKKLSLLEHIVHPWMRTQVRSTIRRTRGHIIIDAALLYRMRLDAICDRVIHIDVPSSTLVSRLVTCRRMKKAAAMRLLARQKDIKRSLSRSDIIIKNTSGTHAFRTVLSFAARLLCRTIKTRPRPPRTSSAIS